MMRLRVFEIVTITSANTWFRRRSCSTLHYLVLFVRFLPCFSPFCYASDSLEINFVTLFRLFKCRYLITSNKATDTKIAVLSFILKCQFFAFILHIYRFIITCNIIQCTCNYYTVIQFWKNFGASKRIFSGQYVLNHVRLQGNLASINNMT